MSVFLRHIIGFISLNTGLLISQVQKELDLFGFRPNLTRRNSDCRWYADENNVQHAYTLHEQIAIDVAVNHRALPHIHFFSVLGLQALQFLNYAAGYNFYMAEYLLAASAYGKDSQRLILDALNYFNGHIGSWIGGAPAEGYPLILLVSGSSLQLVPSFDSFVFLTLEHSPRYFPSSLRCRTTSRRHALMC